MNGLAGPVCERMEEPNVFIALPCYRKRSSGWLAQLKVDLLSFFLSFSVFAWFFCRIVCHFFHLLLFYIFFIRLFAAYTTLRLHILCILCIRRAFLYPNDMASGGPYLSMLAFASEWVWESKYIRNICFVSANTCSHTHCSVQCNVVCRCQYKSIKSHGAFYSHYSNEIVR